MAKPATERSVAGLCYPHMFDCSGTYSIGSKIIILYDGS